ncbi:MAG TPA: hypothetical protein VG125_25875, partial [Pirellulales bacterium]|nr:hypothetical protein [Pirellulales bacterium]
MLDFRSGSTTATTVPYYKQTVDYGRLLMMAISSVLLLGLILTLGRPRSQQPALGQAADQPFERAAG